MVELDSDTLEHALRTAREHGFASVRIKSGEMSFRATLGEMEETEESVTDEAAGPREFTINATVVGYYQDAKVPLIAGNTVHTGDTVAHVMALGLSNDVLASQTGKITEVLVKPGQAVMYGQPLAKLTELE